MGNKQNLDRRTCLCANVLCLSFAITFFPLFVQASTIAETCQRVNTILCTLNIQPIAIDVLIFVSKN